MNEREKKRAYNERVLQIDSVILAPLFFQFMEVWRGNVVPFIQDYLIYLIYQNR